MHHNRLVTKERRAGGVRGKIGVGESGGEGRGGDVAVLAGEVADLACLRVGHVTGVQFAAVGRVQVAKCFGAVAGRGDGEVVDVVD